MFNIQQHLRHVVLALGLAAASLAAGATVLPTYKIGIADTATSDIAYIDFVFGSIDGAAPVTASLSHFVGMPLTSQPQAAPALRLAAGALALSGSLPATSWVKTDTVYSLSETRVIKTLGRVGADTRTYCVQQLCLYLNRGE